MNMPTDLERFVELYQSLGIHVVVNANADGSTWIMLGKAGTEWFSDEGKVTTSKKFNGYNGFYSDIQFDQAGKFVSQGFWE
jgi:hypothetical protein